MKSLEGAIKYNLELLKRTNPSAIENIQRDI